MRSHRLLPSEEAAVLSPRRQFWESSRGGMDLRRRRRSRQCRAEEVAAAGSAEEVAVAQPCGNAEPPAV
eukprot:NODE_6652_length_492_cov_155.961098.p4 GENE.NODE_6652_length_492_cov_155.961098~~NODE_6652_length_492_cov_155.961098.p4  ORF type:complete len:69 (+),score=8.62 NODE_6652_length_492_cov_155.961098:181-387(+)